MVKSMPKDSGMKSMLTVGGKMSRQDQVQVQDGGQQTTRHLGSQKDQQVQLKSTVLSRDTSKHDRWKQEWLMLNYDIGA